MHTDRKILTCTHLHIHTFCINLYIHTVQTHTCTLTKKTHMRSPSYQRRGLIRAHGYEQLEGALQPPLWISHPPVCVCFVCVCVCVCVRACISTKKL